MADGESGSSAESWAAAIHGSETDFSPLGAGVVIDDRRVLTCAHVILAGSTLRTPLWVAFPRAEDGSRVRRKVELVTMPDAMVDWLAAASLAREQSAEELSGLGPDPRELAVRGDVAVLLLAEPVPAGVRAAALRFARPSDLAPASPDGAGHRWRAFGFPGGDPLGRPADGKIGGALAYGWVLLDRSSRHVVEEGFSGSGLWSVDYQAVVALVGQADNDGNGRAITLHEANRCLSGERLDSLAVPAAEAAGEAALAAWGWQLTTDPEGGRHWRPRGRGVSINSERGYRFRGRTAALTTLANWLDRDVLDRRVLVVTGSPGVGKSAVLGRIVTTADASIRAELPASDDAVRASVGSVGCAVHAKGKSALEVATEIARAVPARLPADLNGRAADPADLASAVREVLGEGNARRFNVVIDALDETASPAEARAIVDRIVLPLAETCADVGVQVVVGTRPRDDGGELLGRFGSALSVIDLDKPEYFEQADLSAYALACLQLAGDERAGNPYADSAVAKPTADRIAALADRNFLVAGLVARNRGLRDGTAADPAQITFAGTVDAALASYLERIDSAQVAGRPVFAELRDWRLALTALAYAQAPGLSIALWQDAVRALSGRQVSADELTVFARSSVANFLIESSSGQGRNARVYRLFHQALNDTLLRQRADLAEPADDQRALTKEFIARGRESGWERADEYLLRALPSHAGAAGLIDDLLTDDGYLTHADLARLLTCGARPTSIQAVNRMRLLRLTPEAIGTQSAERAALLSVTDALEALETGYAADRWRPAYRARWAQTRPRSEVTVLEGHAGPVNAVCPVTITDGTTLLATAGEDGTIRLWNPGTGHQTAQLHGHTGAASTVCPVPAADGTTLLATASYDGTVRLWNPGTGHQTAQLHGHHGPVNAMCPATTADGTTLLATAGDDSTVRLWNPGTGPQTAQLHGHTSTVNAMCPVPAADGTTLLATAGFDRTVRLWNPDTGHQTGQLYGHTGPVSTVCPVPAADGTTLLATAGDGGTVWLWNPGTGHQTAQLRSPLPSSVDALCPVTTADGTTLLATAGFGGTVRLWNPGTGQQTTELHGHSSRVNAIYPVTTADGTTLLATASNDRTVRLWDINSASCLMTIPTHHRVWALTSLGLLLAIGLSSGVLVIELNLNGRLR